MSRRQHDNTPVSDNHATEPLASKQRFLGMSGQRHWNVPQMFQINAHANKISRINACIHVSYVSNLSNLVKFNEKPFPFSRVITTQK